MKKKMETKTLKLDVKELTDAGTFEGYASTRAKDLGGDIVAEGAFKRTIDLNEGSFPILWFHRPDQPVGVSLEMREDGHGLYTKGQLNLDKQAGRDVYSDMKMGIVGAMSIGYRTVQAEYDKERDARVIKEVHLYEYSLLTKGFAMQPEAVVTGVKSWVDLGEMVELLAQIKEGKREPLSMEEMADLLWTIDTQVKDGRVLKGELLKAVQFVTEGLDALMAKAQPAATEPGDGAGTQTPSDDSPEGHSSAAVSEKHDSEALHSMLREMTEDMHKFGVLRAMESLRVG